jgi:hypothetical protein
MKFQSFSTSLFLFTFMKLLQNRNSLPLHHSFLLSHLIGNETNKKKLNNCAIFQSVLQGFWTEKPKECRSVSCCVWKESCLQVLNSCSFIKVLCCVCECELRCRNEKFFIFFCIRHRNSSSLSPKNSLLNPYFLIDSKVKEQRNVTKLIAIAKLSRVISFILIQRFNNLRHNLTEKMTRRRNEYWNM